MLGILLQLGVPDIGKVDLPRVRMLSHLPQILSINQFKPHLIEVGGGLVNSCNVVEILYLFELLVGVFSAVEVLAGY